MQYEDEPLTAQVEAEQIDVELDETKVAKKMARQTAIDFKDREYDSDDEIKKNMKTYDERLTYINKYDNLIYKHQTKKTDLGEIQSAIKDNGLPIVLHEREIME